MNNKAKDMSKIGVFTKNLEDVGCSGFEFNHADFPLDYVKDVVGAVSRYMSAAKASGHKACVGFNIAMYKAVSPALRDAHIQLVASNVSGDDVQCHSVAYFEDNGVSKRIDSEPFSLIDVLAYVESVEPQLVA